MNRKTDPSPFTTIQVYPNEVAELREMLPQFRNDAERLRQLMKAFHLLEEEINGQAVWVPTVRKEE